MVVKWELQVIKYDNEKAMIKALADGYEPFAATSHNRMGTTTTSWVWLRKPIDK